MSELGNWTTLKVRLTAKRWAPRFHEREIWWCSIGLNIGCEVFGKGNKFRRPVLVVKKFNSEYFFGIPLSSSDKVHDYYHRFTFQNTEQAALISQARTFDGRRLNSMMGTLPDPEFELIRAKFADLVGLK